MAPAATARLPGASLTAVPVSGSQTAWRMAVSASESVPPTAKSVRAAKSEAASTEPAVRAA